MESLKGALEERAYLDDKRGQLRDALSKCPLTSASTADELRAFDTATTDLVHIDRQIERNAQEIARLERRDDENKCRLLAAADLAEHRDWLGNVRTSNYGELTARERKHAFNAWARARTGVKPSERGIELAKRAGFDSHGDSLYFDLEDRAMATTSSTNGAKAVPQGFAGRIEAALKAYGGVREVATIVPTGGGEAMKFPTSDDTSNTGRILAENTAATATDIAISNIQLDAYKHSSDLVLVSVELLQDEDVDLEAFIGSRLGERLGRITNSHFTTGTGSSQPNGIVTAATSGVTAASTSAVTYGELVNLQHSVDPLYQRSAVWMMNWTTIGTLKKLLDGDGRPIWQPAAQAGMGEFPETLLGKRVVVNQDMPAMTTGLKPILYGDASKYLIREVRQIQLLKLVERYADQHSVGFLAYLRTDGDLQDAGTHPVKVITMA